MIIELMTYTTAVSLLLGLAALAIERAFALAAWPRRWLWAGAMVISLGGSAAMSFVPHVAPGALPSPAVTATKVPASQGIVLPSFPLAVQPLRSRAAVAAPTWPMLETYAKWTWLATSLLLLGVYLVGAMRLLNARRQWPQQEVGQYAVLVSENVGPAVFGLLRPVIVMPQWLLDQPISRRDAALLHEDQHLAAHDPALLLLALLLLALTPWNLPLWWQLRRLRLAIEVDCDTRVLRTGMERRHYMDTLLCINQYAGKMPLGAVAIVGRASQLERRVRAMTMSTPRHVRLWIAGWAVATIPLLVVAAQLDPPVSVQASAPAAPHAHLGIGVADFDVNTPATSITHLERRGALVTYVEPGDVADRAGLKRGDVVVRFADTAIVGMITLTAAVAHTAVDARIPLVVHRGTEDVKLVADFSAALPAKAPFGGKPVDASDWDALRDANMAISQPQLREELIRMVRLDEQVQQFQRIAKNLPSRPNTEFIVPAPRVEPADSAANVGRLKEIITQYGWPTVSMVGVRGATAAGMIAFGAHDDPAFQAAALALMEPLLQRDEVPSMYYASLFDTVHTPQRFGMNMDCRNGVMTPAKPIEDPQHLEQRRAALGLPDESQFCVSMLHAKSGG